MATPVGGGLEAFSTVAAPGRVQSTEDPYERVLGRLEGVKASGTGHKAKCPAHEDRQPSLSVSRGSDGRVLVKCHTGCSFDAVVEKMGLTPADLFPPSPNGMPLKVMVGGSGVAESKSSSWGTIEKTYDYVDDGVLCYQTVRKMNPKGFYQRRPDGNGGWVNDLRGVKRVLYQRPALFASDPAETVFLPEGEKDVDNLRALGLVATTAAMGAGSWISNYNQDVADRDVVVLVDNDKPGRDHAEKVAAQLVPVARSVKVLALPGLPDGGDVSDWLDAGGTTERLRQLAEVAAPFHSAATTGSAAESILPWSTARQIATETPEATEYVAYPLAAAGSLSELDSAPKRGKTTLMLAMAASVVRGEGFLGYPTIKGPVVYLTEQAAASFRAALDRAGLLESDDFHVLSWPKVSRVSWPDVMTAAVAKALEVGARLVIVDTLGQWAGIKGDAENDAGSALAAVQPLQEAAANHNLAVVALRHERKAGGDVGESARGSSAFAGSVDSIFRLRRPEGNQVKPNLRVLDALSRFSDIPEQMVLELTDDGFLAHGDGAHLAFNQALKAVTDAAPMDRGEALAADALFEAAGVKRTLGQKVLKALVDNTTLAKFGAGVKGDPVRYWRPDPDEIHSAPNGDAVAAECISLPESASNGSATQDGLDLWRRGPSTAPSLDIHSAVTATPTAAEGISSRHDDVPFDSDEDAA